MPICSATSGISNLSPLLNRAPVTKANSDSAVLHCSLHGRRHPRKDRTGPSPGPPDCPRVQRLDRAFAQQTKTAIRRAAEEKGLDLGLERVSLWRERGDRDFEHLGSTRTIYLAFQEADHYQDEIFVFDAIGGEALTFITRSPQEGG
jgi:hypothetical protein